MPAREVAIARSANAVVVEWKELVVLQYDTQTNSVVAAWRDDALEELGADAMAVRDAYQATTSPTPQGRRGPARG